ncbi:MAG: PQQ-dependent sugar dehydrogenase [Gammaproteobacteria bacterium]
MLIWLALGFAGCGGGGGDSGGDDSGGVGPFGLESRPANSTCLAPARPDGNATVSVVDAFPSTPDFNQPTKILQARGDGARWFVLEKTGRVRVFNTGNPASVTTWLNFSTQVNTSSEGGLLGMAFHPDYPVTRQVFVSYTATVNGKMVSRVSRILLDNVTAPSSTTEQILLTVDQPFNNHNGGDIAFGPDGFLYLGLGDGGSANDPFGNSQNDTRLLGTMLRIGVVNVAWPSPGYTIPSDNPFAGNAKCGPADNVANCPEIYATGLRNPWRWSFDEPTGDLWAGDVGQGSREEIDRIQLGGNYGWNCREGFIGGPGNCSPAGVRDPVSDYPHADGDNSITGGYVYRGTSLPILVGRYVFGDFGSGRIWALEDDGQGGYSNDLLVDTPYNISAFAAGEDGELYFADFGNGRIRRLAPSGGGTGNSVATDLAATGCVDASDPTRPATGLIPYTVNASFWSDGAGKERYLALPDNSRISRTATGDFTFPPGSVLLKSFRLGGQLIETRLLMRHPDGVWAGYTYEWNAAQTAATRVIGGKTRQVGAVTWIYPSEGECMQCHTAAAAFALGPQIAQVNGLLDDPSSGITANQLATLEHIALFTTALPDAPENLPALVDPGNPAASLTDRARAYLDTNCAQCHQPGGPTPSSMDLRATPSLAAMQICNVTPQTGDLGVSNARLLAPADANRSILVRRMNRRDVNAMPPIGSSAVDADGVALLTDWINSLSSCSP